MTLWKSNTESIDESPNPYIILREYAEKVAPDTDNKFVGMVTEAIREDKGEASYALYIVVPKLRDYMYRLFEATLDDLVHPYPMTLRFFAKDPRNNQTYICQTPTELKNNLVELITSIHTQNILGHLQQLVDINEKYSSDSQ